MMENLITETFSSVSAPIQYAAIKAFTEPHTEYKENSVKILHAVAEYMHK